MDTTEHGPATGTAATAGAARAAAHALLGLVVAVAAVGIPGDPHERPAHDSPTTCCGIGARTTTPEVGGSSTRVVTSTDDGATGSATSSPDRVAGHLGGIAARLHTPDGAPIAGDVFLLMGAHGLTENARLYDQTPYTHDAGAHSDTIASNVMAYESIRALTEVEFDLVEFTNAPGGGTSGGVTRAIAYLNVISDFTGDLRIAATGRLEPGGHLGSIDHIDAKAAAAYLADADVLFTPTVPTPVTSVRYGTRLIGEIARDPSDGTVLHHPKRLERFHTWGATRAGGMDIVDARHLIDVSTYLCGTGSTFACDITERLVQQVQRRQDQLHDQVSSEFERFRTVTRQDASSDTAVA